MRMYFLFVAWIGIAIGYKLSLACSVPQLEPVNLALNTPEDEDEPQITPNGLRLFYLLGDDEKKLVASSRKSETEAWKTPKPAMSADMDVIAENKDIRGLFLDQEKKEPFYVYYAARDSRAKKPNFDIFVAIKTLPGADKVYTEPRALISIDTLDDEAHPWLSLNGKTLFFSRKTRDGWHQFMAQRKDSRGTLGFDSIQDLGFPAGFHHATVMPSGKAMVLQGPLSGDRWGLFVSYRKDTDWSDPEPLDGLNHPKGSRGDLSPCLTRDGKRLYFASDRPKGKGGLDLWTIPTNQLLKQ